MTEASRGKSVILAVEDHEPSRYLLARSLSLSGYEVVEAGDGAEALLRAPGAHAIVLDVHLPDIDGFEVCRRLKQNPATADIPVIFLTATATDAQSIRIGTQAGAAAYLRAASDHDTLIAVLQHKLGNRRPESAERL